MLKVVVLPAPFGPSRPTISPAATVMETPLTPRRWRYSLTNLSVASSGSRTAEATGAAEPTFCLRGSVWGSSMRFVSRVCAPEALFREFFVRQHEYIGINRFGLALDFIVAGEAQFVLGAIPNDEVVLKAKGSIRVRQGSRRAGQPKLVDGQGAVGDGIDDTKRVHGLIASPMELAIRGQKVEHYIHFGDHICGARSGELDGELFAGPIHLRMRHVNTP